MGVSWISPDDPNLPKGLYLSRVAQGSAAERSGVGLHLGQRLTHINGVPVYSMHDMLAMRNTSLDKAHGTQALVLRFATDVSAKSILNSAAVAAPPPAAASHFIDDENNVTIHKSNQEGLGCVLEEMLLRSVAPHTPAHTHGLQRFLGRKLTHVNNVPVDDLDAVQKISATDTVQLTFGGYGVPTRQSVQQQQQHQQFHSVSESNFSDDTVSQQPQQHHHHHQSSVRSYPPQLLKSPVRDVVQSPSKESINQPIYMPAASPVASVQMTQQAAVDPQPVFLTQQSAVQSVASNPVGSIIASPLHGHSVVASHVSPSVVASHVSPSVVASHVNPSITSPVASHVNPSHVAVVDQSFAHTLPTTHSVVSPTFVSQPTFVSPSHPSHVGASAFASPSHVSAYSQRHPTFVSSAASPAGLQSYVSPSHVPSALSPSPVMHPVAGSSG
eukprot:TRINITY_DN12147_c0_g1_i1.p1 TRINITY_DN12147_c0_g1~~TRINITY_DN12147_c0_g1_i1.p1  ORF type:complete len:454 (+),score=93.30 TRINITY_DN12147_c0_g1_i1:38-1363(+)